MRGAVVSIMLVALGALACSKAETYCAFLCECEHCSARAEDSCQVSFHEQADYAESSGCSDEFDALTSCQTDTAQCSAEHEWSSGACEGETQAFSTCLGGGGA